MFAKSLTAATALVLSASLAFAAAPTYEAQSTPSTPQVESYEVAGTNGMNRRGDRRDTRQDCRQSEGAVGKDKRDCKQDGRQGS
ncbi:hypothetical protein SAMN05444000_104173 [Shimia gijangensis]|uniref:Uncharacterized protein n=1 Tax=Shimia gijangensis TaxID=1470563 RepID=A0A1M6FV58_9RHOB|nr:hypothetical protein [Shimia gijangensis]SHJ01558.1 hypothetical protein SAMN05444000_104173 [Shimia gijangensis]